MKSKSYVYLINGENFAGLRNQEVLEELPQNTVQAQFYRFLSRELLYYR
jgi:hypothetical protein